MLKNTFCHIPGIGPKFERRLWDKGILSWEALLNSRETVLTRRVPSFKLLVNESLEQFDAGNPNYFSALLHAKEHWRIFPHYRDSIAYIDIETNGFAGPYGYITAISLYDGKNVRYYVRGENLDNFKKDIEEYKVIVTYNGKCFDVPFIENHFRMRMPQAHIDLRYILRDLGFRGGLKGCEKQIGIDRGELDGLDGYFAVLLWNDYKRNRNVKALETLLAYNIQDVINLEPLMITAYNLKLKNTPFNDSLVVPPASHSDIVLPFNADVDTIERILHEQASRKSKTVQAL
ncbi:MAG: ribonuclease H-like domain-containing protein [Deltaproteobacteria bacterium]|nr:ribonuclease H-like domain-containing protein [Deltaproteobacteria bacterium]